MKIELELTFPEELKNEPIIWELCKNFEIILRIIEASFSTSTGWAIIVIEGEKVALGEVVQFLSGKGVAINDNKEL